MTTIIAISGFAVLFVLLVGTIVTRYKVAGPNEAFIITGRRDKRAVENLRDRGVIRRPQDLGIDRKSVV